MLFKERQLFHRPFKSFAMLRLRVSQGMPLDTNELSSYKEIRQGEGGEVRFWRSNIWDGPLHFPLMSSIIE